MFLNAPPDKDECAIAEEFNTNELPIHQDLEKREGKRSLCNPTSIAMLNRRTRTGTVYCPAEPQDRIRSISTSSPMHFCGQVTRRYFREKQHGDSDKELTKFLALRALRGGYASNANVTPKHNRSRAEHEVDPTVVPPDQDESYVRSDAEGTIGIIKAITFHNSCTEATKGCRGDRFSSVKRQRVSPTQRAEEVEKHHSPNRTANVTPLRQTAALRSALALSDGKIDQEIKQRFSILVSKGCHKFASTAQPMQKMPHNRSEMDEPRMLEPEETVGRTASSTKLDQRALQRKDSDDSEDEDRPLHPPSTILKFVRVENK